MAGLLNTPPSTSNQTIGTITNPNAPASATSTGYNASTVDPNSVSKATGTGYTGSTIDPNSISTATGTGYSANTVDPNQVNKTSGTGYSAAQNTVNPNQTVAGQFASDTDPNSVLMTQANTLGSQQSNARGLLNSSIGISAADDSMYKAALPIAQQDATTNANSSLANQNATNTASQFGAAATNTANLNNQQAINSQILSNQNATNSANQFGAAATNTANLTDAQLKDAQITANQNSTNTANQFTAGATNTANLANASASNNQILSNQNAINTAGQFNAGAANDIAKANLSAQTQTMLQTMQDSTTAATAQLSSDTQIALGNLSSATQTTIQQLTNQNQQLLQQSTAAANNFNTAMTQLGAIATSTMNATAKGTASDNVLAELQNSLAAQNAQFNATAGASSGAPYLNSAQFFNGSYGTSNSSSNQSTPVVNSLNNPTLQNTGYAPPITARNKFNSSAGMYD